MTAAEEIRDALERALARQGESDQLLAIIANRNIDPADVVEWAAFYFNDSWMPKINAKLQEGFVTVRIQTELDISGHETMIYMAKMKTTLPPTEGVKNEGPMDSCDNSGTSIPR